MDEFSSQWCSCLRHWGSTFTAGRSVILLEHALLMETENIQKIVVEFSRGNITCIYTCTQMPLEAHSGLSFNCSICWKKCWKYMELNIYMEIRANTATYTSKTLRSSYFPNMSGYVFQTKEKARTNERKERKIDRKRKRNLCFTNVDISQTSNVWWGIHTCYFIWNKNTGQDIGLVIMLIEVLRDDDDDNDINNNNNDNIIIDSSSAVLKIVFTYWYT